MARKESGQSPIPLAKAFDTLISQFIEGFAGISAACEDAGFDHAGYACADRCFAFVEMLHHLKQTSQPDRMPVLIFSVDIEYEQHDAENAILFS
jgi:hypothetical protein